MSANENNDRESGFQVGEDGGAPSARGLSRRRFLGSAAGVGAAGLFLSPASSAAAQSAGTLSLPVPGTAAADDALGPVSPAKRRNLSYRVRVTAAQQNRALPLVDHQNNGDDDLYGDRRGSYSKGLIHDSIGEVVPSSYQSLLDALESGKRADFESIAVGNPGGSGPPAGITPVHRMINPMSGLAFDLEGTDSHQLPLAPAPAFASAWAAGEIVENYWMAFLRDVPFTSYGTSALAAAAIADLNALSDFRGPKQAGAVTAQTLFREGFPGCTVGPYLSQFFWLSQPFGTQDIDPRTHTAAAGVDYLTDQATWLARQNGINPLSGDVPGGLVYMRNGRDLGQWVHVDVLFQAYFQALLTMSALGVPANPGNPYNTSATQVAFGTFGGPHAAALLCEVATRALKVVWFQKWFVHRRLRPEVFGGRVHVHLTGQKAYDLHGDVLSSGAVAEAFSRNGTYFVPMAFPEGSPAHPAYGAGHATVAGACVTVLKALFDAELPCTDFFTPVVADPSGASLGTYTGGDVGQMTVAGELNKIGANVAIGRNIAGVHWRTDGTESMKLGEAVAISILRDQRLTFPESFGGFTFTKFDGTQVTV
jgi:hypothetical protein